VAFVSRECHPVATLVSHPLLRFFGSFQLKELAMSKKKWRRPAGVVPPVTVAKQDVNPQADASAKVEALADAARAARQETPMPPAPVPFARYDLNVSDDEAQGFINEMTRFLGGVVRRTNVILGKVSIAGFRKTVAGDLPAPDAEPVETTIEAAEKALPRSHPLLALIRYAMAASRLLNRILLTTKPHLFGRPSNAFKNAMQAARASEQFLKGRVPPEVMREAIGHAPL
jgi:hypothetical protein